MSGQKINPTLKIEIKGVLAAWVEVDGNYLQLIGVDPDFRGLGLAVEIFQKLLAWMRTNNKKNLAFLDNNPGFWQAMKQKFPKNIYISPSGDGQIRAF